MSRSSPWLGLFAAALLLSPALCERAQAFGGLWSSQPESIEQSRLQVLFVDHPGPTVTAIVRLEYAGPSQTFAWLIPVPAKPTVGVSSSTVFQRLDAATAPQYWVEVTVAGTCVDEETDVPLDPLEVPGAPVVVVVDQGSVAPYDYVTIEVDPALEDPAEAATDWLAMNGYRLNGLEAGVLDDYLEDGFALLAIKLAEGEDPSALRPLVLTYESERPVIPLRPTAVAAQDALPIQLWVLGTSQAVPANYKALVLNDALIDWLSGETFAAGTLPAGGVGPFGPMVRPPRNYDRVVGAAVREAGGRGFVTELGAPASQYRDKVWSVVDEEQYQAIATQSYEDGVDAIAAAAPYYSAWDGFRAAVEGATSLPDDVELEDFVRDPGQYRGLAVVDAGVFLQLLAEQVITPVTDAAALLFEAPYLTRLYTVMSPDDMTVDPELTYNPDLAQIGAIHIAKQSIECGPDLERQDAPWRIDLPQGGVVVGDGGGEWPVEEGSLPANLKVVELSEQGGGTVVEDNSADIARKLIAAAGTTGTGSALQLPPLLGVPIGGGRTDVSRAEPGATRGRTKHDGRVTCSVAQPGTRAGTAAMPSLLFAALLLALRARRLRSLAACAFAALVLLACGDDDDGKPARADSGTAQAGTLTREQLLDPETCRGCHPVHYREWSASMHAYAAKDPVFIAMNRRGQRETNGELGDFCIRCHAPMAVVDGLSEDGLNLDELPDRDRGVSCYFCHNVVEIEGDHNAMLRLANDTTMRGPIEDAFPNDAHGSEHSEMFEDTRPESSDLCGGCHDIVTPSGVHLERTLEEYRYGIFSKSATGEPPAFDSCVGCHMSPRDGYAAAAPAGVGMRTVHEHLWPGIDVALTDFPHRDAMRSAIEDCQLGASISFFTLEVTPPDLFTFQFETNAGHNQPSGSAQDRRMWLEFLAYDEHGELLEDVSSGNIADREIEERPEDDPKHDPHLLMLRDRIYDAQGKPVHMFWEAAKSKAYPKGYESNVLPVATTTYVEGKHAVIKQYRASGPDGELPARVTARLRIRPIGLDVLEDLVRSGDLDPAIAAEMPTFSFGAQLEWTREQGLMKPITVKPFAPECSKYQCMLEPSGKDCE